MKVKSNLIFNTALLSAHAPAVQDGKVVIGGGVSKELNIPAGSTIEVVDAIWVRDFQEAAKDHIEHGSLTIVEDVKLSEADQDKADAAELKKLEAKAKKLKAKANKNKEG
tara:strand:- start:4487 stop:4816 length:330 start_codon:yes stop_codon:yes gene_type:complete